MHYFNCKNMSIHYTQPLKTSVCIQTVLIYKHFLTTVKFLHYFIKFTSSTKILLSKKMPVISLRNNLYLRIWFGFKFQPQLIKHVNFVPRLDKIKVWFIRLLSFLNIFKGSKFITINKVNRIHQSNLAKMSQNC